MNPHPNRARGILAATRYLEANVRDRTARRIFLALVACALAMAIGAVCAARTRELLRPDTNSLRMPTHEAR